jgi:hypothetical protein
MNAIYGHINITAEITHMTPMGRTETVSIELQDEEAWMAFDALNDSDTNEMVLKQDDVWGICEQFNATQVYITSC